MSVDEEDLVRDIAALAACYAEKEPEQVTQSLRLFSDLKLDGDDAYNLMAEFAARYDVDMSDFHWLRYFGDEGWDFLQPFLVLLACANPRVAARWRAAEDAEREITIGHLADVARERRWLHPSETFRRRSHRPSAALALLLAAPMLVLATIGTIACYGLLIGGLGDVSWLAAATVIAMALFPLLMAWISWRNIQRKLASGSVAAEGT